MRLELTCVGLLVQLANHYTTRGALTRLSCVSQHFRDINRPFSTLVGALPASAPEPVLDFGPERGPGKGTMADLGPLIRHLVSTRLPSGGRAAFLSPLSPMCPDPRH